MSNEVTARRSVISRFSLTLIDLLDRVQYRRVLQSDEFDPVYRLRYAAYRREGLIPISSRQVARDEYDDLPNCQTFGVYIDERLVSSIRLHVASETDDRSPSRAVWPQVVGDLTKSGGSYIELTRFTADHEATLAFPALPYLTMRIAVMASQYFEALYTLFAVRPEHAPFYKRIFGATQLAGEGYSNELQLPVSLYAAQFREVLPRVVDRYPFFASTSVERSALFDEDGLPYLIRPTARDAQPYWSEAGVLAETSGRAREVDVQMRVRSIADSFEISAAILADTAGLRQEELTKNPRLAEMLAIVSSLAEATNVDEKAAMEWFRTFKLPAFGGKTAAEVFRSGRGELVREYVDHLSHGGYA